MKLLILIHRLPCPPDRGAKQRVAAQLSYLARRHEVWCAGFLDGGSPDPATGRALAELRTRCRDVAAIPLHGPLAAARALGSLCRGGTCTEGYFGCRRLERRVMAWSRSVGFDAVLAFSSGMAPLALRVDAKRRVLDFDDLDSVKWAELAEKATLPMSWVYRAEAQRLAEKERAWMAAFDASVFVSERETRLIDDPTLRGRAHVIEAGIPARRGLSDDGRDGNGREAIRLPDEPVVGFLGAMDYAPNVDAVRWFADAIWPSVVGRRPDAQWWIVGRSPTRAVRRLHDGARIHVTGTVAAVEPWLDRMRVCIAPMRVARGVQIKVLMAMASGRPCVVTPAVAEGIPARDGREWIVADGPVAFAKAVVGLLDDGRRAEAMGRDAAAFIARHYDPDEGAARLEALLAGTGDDGRGGGSAFSSSRERPEPVLCAACEGGRQ